MLAGCATSRPGRGQTFRGISPLDVVPKDFAVYLKAERSALNIPVINERFEVLAAGMGIPGVLHRRVHNVTAVFLEDNWGYVAAHGRYPNSVIRNWFVGRTEWEEGLYRRVNYFFSNNTNTVVILLRNIIIVSDFPAGYADLRARKIIDIIMSGETVAPASSRAANSVFHITSHNPGDVFAEFIVENVSLDNIRKVSFDIILDPRSKESGGVNISFLLENEEKAVVFNSIIRLFISDYVVRNRITTVRALRDNNSIFRDGAFVHVNLRDIPLEKLNRFIADFMM